MKEASGNLAERGIIPVTLFGLLFLSLGIGSWLILMVQVIPSLPSKLGIAEVPSILTVILTLTGIFFIIGTIMLALVSGKILRNLEEDPGNK
jgi:cell division protein FtsX